MTGGTVLVLGHTGRNVAAGMSGGTAYVLDLDRGRVNAAAVASGELGLHPLDEADRVLVADLLVRHRDETGSEVAAALLAEGDAGLDRVTKLLPREFSRVLAVREQARTEGLDLDGDAVWSRIVEATRG
jgi:glutamate synthase (NADPH/NADH) large chain